MKQVTIEVSSDLFNELRKTSIYQAKTANEVVLDILKRYYNGRKD